MNTYEIIKELAKEKGLSIRQLEMNFGYSNGYLGSWKRQTPNSIELARLADYFGVSVDYLLGRTDTPQNVENKDEYDDLVMMFRKNEMEIPEDRRDEYRREVEKLMDFVKFTMKELDEKNKNK